MATVTSPALSAGIVARTPTLADIASQLHVPADRILLYPTPGTATVKDVVAIHDRENRLCELVDGVLVEKSIGLRESVFACVLVQIFKNFVDQHRTGLVAGPDGMMQLALGLVRIPDVSFVSRDQYPSGRPGREPVPLLRPTLAVEILSVSNSPTEMEQKLRDYFAAGSQLFWYLDPAERTVRVYTSPENFVTLDETGTLEGGEVLPRLSARSPRMVRQGRRSVWLGLIAVLANSRWRARL
jgi:Uma2 family endonuclease